MINTDYYITNKKDRYISLGENQFMMEFVDGSFEGFDTTVDGNLQTVPMIIQKHTNPLNKNLHDMKAKYLDSSGDFMHIGNIVSFVDLNNKNKVYLAVTQPSSNGIYSEYKIYPLEDDMVFHTDKSIQCTVANKGFYDESSFTNETNVFEDKELRAALIQYNQDTKNLRLFDNVYINGVHYKIVKIDNHTLKEHDEEFGVSQLVVIDTPFGVIKKNDIEEIRGTLMGERVKDKILNSVSRGLLCEHNKVSRGDYITFEYDRDNQGTMKNETYIVFNKPTMEGGYDRSLTYLCESEMSMLNNEGDVVKIPLYFDDNRSRIDKTTDNEFMKFLNSSYLFAGQYNDVTKRIVDYKVTRVYIDGLPHEITGFDPYSDGLIKIGVKSSQKGADDKEIDGVWIADYGKQMDEINKDNPSTPTGEIIEENGYEDLQVGYPNTYLLDGAGSGVTWSVDVSWCELTQDGTKCTLVFNDRKQAGKSVILTARYMGNTFTKTIQTVGLR